MKIVVRLPNWLGDLVMALPFLHYLRQEYGQARIVLIVRPELEGVLGQLPWQAELVPLQRREKMSVFLQKYGEQINNADLFFVLPPSFSSAWMSLRSKASRRVGFGGDFRGWLLNMRGKRAAKILHRSQEYLHLLSLVTGKEYGSGNLGTALLGNALEMKLNLGLDPERRFVVVNPNSEASSRRLPLEKWLELLTNLEYKQEVQGREKWDWVFIGGAKDMERVEQLAFMMKEISRTRLVNLAGKTSLVQLAGVLSRAHGVLSNDSGPAHLASAVAARVCVFFGAGDENNTAPVGDSSKVMVMRKKDLSCSPCLKNECPLKTLECLKALSMEEWAGKIFSFLG